MAKKKLTPTSTDSAPAPEVEPKKPRKPRKNTVGPSEAKTLAELLGDVDDVSSRSSTDPRGNRTASAVKHSHFGRIRKPTQPLTDEGLTPQQESYCRARATGMTMHEASVTCNIPKPTAFGWEYHNQRVKARITELSKLLTNNAIVQTGLDREWVISRLMSVAERCMQAEPVLDKDGNSVGEYTFDSAGANQALKMLGDTLGLFKPPEKQAGDDFANLTDDDLKRLASELAQQTGLLEHKSDIIIDA